MILSEKNFKRILQRYTTLAFVFQAINRTERLISNNQSIHKYSTVHELIKIIFSTCGVKEL